MQTLLFIQRGFYAIFIVKRVLQRKKYEKTKSVKMAKDEFKNVLNFTSDMGGGVLCSLVWTLPKVCKNLEENCR